MSTYAPYMPAAGMGSYYAGNYFKNPVPYTASDIGAPVPGWGTSIQIAGPPRLGVGGPVLDEAAGMAGMVLVAGIPAAALGAIFAPSIGASRTQGAVFAGAISGVSLVALALLFANR